MKKLSLWLLVLAMVLLCAGATAEEAELPPEGYLRITGIEFIEYADDIAYKSIHVLLDTGDTAEIRMWFEDWFEDAAFLDGTCTRFRMDFSGDTLRLMAPLVDCIFEKDGEHHDIPVIEGMELAYVRDGDTYTFLWPELSEEYLDAVAALKASYEESES